VYKVSLVSAHHRASFLAASQHSGDWLFALPIASCGLRLDDKAVRVAVWLEAWVSNFAFHTSATVAPEVMPADFTALTAKKPRPGLRDIAHLTVWSLALQLRFAASLRLEFPSPGAGRVTPVGW